MSARWQRLNSPLKVGLVVGTIGALLTVVGLLMGHLAPLTLRSLLLGVLVGGGSRPFWGR